MSAETAFTKENLEQYFLALSKECRKLNGTKMLAEIILVGGAAVLVNYGFREMTYDVDAMIMASSVMKEAINRVGDRLGLPHGWFNAGFKNTKSYSERLPEVSVYYKTFSNILTVRTITAEYLVAMKLMSGRLYKFDKSDVIGILWEQQKKGMPITSKAVDEAMNKLYGGWVNAPEQSKEWFRGIFAGNLDYEALYLQSRAGEMEAKDILLKFDKDYPGTLKGDNINSVIESIRAGLARSGENGQESKEKTEPENI